MRKPSLGLIAASAILTSGLAFAQSEPAHPQSPVDSPAVVPTSGTQVIPGTSATAQGDEKPLQTPEEKAEQDKRIFGVLPNYRTADGTKQFVPMNAKGKIHIALKDSFDYPSYILAAGLALVYQAEDQNPSFGQGVEGYLRRYGAGIGDQVIGNMMTEGFMPSLLREDPRYFRKVTGGFWSRLAYSSTRTLIAKDDHGKDCFNFSEILGNGVGAAIGAAYYPDGRTVGLTFERMGTAIATDTISNVLKEFWPDIKRKYWHKHRSQDPITP
jgi:hypothetical protein